jgi:hypothetical protein
VHKSDQLAESEPSDGIPLEYLGQNPHYLAFRPQGDLVYYDMMRGMAQAFYNNVKGGYVGAKLVEGAYASTGIQPEPEGLYPNADIALKNDKLVQMLLEDMRELSGYLFIHADFDVVPKRKSKPSSIRTLYDSQSAKQVRKELKEKRDAAARELKLAKNREKKAKEEN